jgi:hypothetical protein
MATAARGPRTSPKKGPNRRARWQGGANLIQKKDTKQPGFIKANDIRHPIPGGGALKKPPPPPARAHWRSRGSS